MYPFSSDRRETASPLGRATPSIGEEAGPGEVVAPVSPVMPAPVWEKRQPQVDRRSVLPVEWFRRMPGGSTTYAPPAADESVDAG